MHPSKPAAMDIDLEAQSVQPALPKAPVRIARSEVVPHDNEKSRLSAPSPELKPPGDASGRPIEEKLWFAGFLFFPCWVLGGFWKWRTEYDSYAELSRWRCQVMTMLACIIILGLLVVEIPFRGR
ncbi:hypothetical protein B0H21DRAFT_847105 [Amylocystis lapponica]|nr:hypothetical protein B0H21DRAFT_847105 [Amylocystis lapponica]